MATDPGSLSQISLTTIAIACLGPLAGPYAVIVFSALGGSLWPVLAATTNGSKVAGGVLLLRCLVTSVFLTGIIATCLARYYDLRTYELLSPVSFLIAAMGNGWKPVFDTLGSGLAGFFRGVKSPSRGMNDDAQN